MRRSLLLWIAGASLLLALCASGATRPHYGGTLRIEMRAAPVSLDPVQTDAARLTPLLFDTLVVLDDFGNPRPGLARGWQARNDNRRWQLPLRSDVKLADGTPLTPTKVAGSLASANPGWHITAQDDAVLLDFDTPRPHLPAELARPRNAIAVRDQGKLVGTGPYRLAEFQPGRRAVLAANDDYWGGRPFVDSVEVEMGRAYRDQTIDLDSGKADVIEIAPEQARRSMQEGRRVELSSPIELVALQFTKGHAATEDIHLRQTIAWAVDRVALNNGLLQRQGEPAGALLPQWLSGYAFLFPATADLARARESRPLGDSRLTLTYDASDLFLRVIADRVALNARDAGLIIQVVPNWQNADARVVRVSIDSAVPAAALAGVVTVLDPADLPAVTSAASPQALYAAERTMLDEYHIVPLVHIPEVYALGQRVRNWDESRVGGWPLVSAWIDQQLRKDQP